MTLKKSTLETVYKNGCLKFLRQKLQIFEFVNFLDFDKVEKVFLKIFSPPIAPQSPEGSNMI